MSILNPVNGEIFTVRIYKYHANSPDRIWANTYELQAQVGPDYAELLAAGQKLVAMEKLIHATAIEFSNMVISTYVPDGEPYDPASFVSISQSGAGNRTSGTAELLPTGLVFYVSRNVLSGRQGRLFYRGALFESEMHAPAGTPRLTDPAAMETMLQNSITTAGVDDMFAAGPDPFYLVMASGTNTRTLTGMTAKGVRQVRVDHRYYDRAP